LTHISVETGNKIELTTLFLTYEAYFELQIQLQRRKKQKPVNKTYRKKNLTGTEFIRNKDKYVPSA
jgi:hypothetical protein